MVPSLNIFLLPLKFAAICIFIAVDILLVVLLLNSIQVLDISLYAYSGQTTTEEADPEKDMLKSLGADMKHAAQTIGTTITGTVTAAGTAVGTAAQTVAATTGNVTANIATTIANPETIIRPEPSYKVPEIEAVPTPVTIAASPTEAAVQPAAAVTTAPAPQPSQTTAWPLRGHVTTEFGVPHHPYQPRHTGMDISSYLPSGRIGITPFREGVVIETVRSSRGLGNHIVIDHGGGLTSTYAHLSVISVAEGQTVKPGDTIGREGSTGTSTGTHLHFEIRENGTPVNPRKYIGN